MPFSKMPDVRVYPVNVPYYFLSMEIIGDHSIIGIIHLVRTQSSPNMHTYVCVSGVRNSGFTEKNCERTK